MILTQLFIYPLKSGRGIALREMELGDRGPVGDRRWMLIGPDGNFHSQRTIPRMALLEVRERAGNNGNGITCNAPGMPELFVATPLRAARLSAQLWDDIVEVLAPGAEADAWFSTFLETPCRLAYQPDDSIRPIAPEYSQPGDHVSLADGFPLLLISQGSLDALNEKLAEPVAMARFRPNVVVSGTAPHEEDTWRRIRIGTIEFDLPKPCTRCRVPAVDPETGVAGTEPVPTLARYRKFGKKVLFGQNAIHRSRGVIRLADPVVVLQKSS